MVAAISKVRDEADIVESIIRHMATQVDFLIVADHRSVDGTREILDSLADVLPLSVRDDPQAGHYQGQTVTALAREARESGAEWVVPFDADEWHFSPDGRIGDILAERPEDVAIIPSYTHVATGRDDREEADPVRRMGWREPERFVLPKVACRTLPGLTIHEGSHFVDYGDRRVTRVLDLLEIRHFQYRSPEQFARKIANGIAAFAETDLEESVGVHWRQYSSLLKREGPEALREVFWQRHFRHDPEAEVVVDGEKMPPLVFDPAPR